MPALSRHAAAENLARFLGDPREDGPLSFKRILELDETGTYPEELCRAIQEWGLPQYLVPAELGGQLRSFEEALAIFRTISSRDLTAAVALGQTYLGAVHLWIAGTREQKQRAASLIRENKQLAFALTEKAHGSDIQSNETFAEKDPRNYIVNGEKWLINNGTRAAALTVFARTRSQGGPRGFSLLFVDKDKLDSRSYFNLPKIPTIGVRGADISGVRFQNCRITHDSVIGSEGDGLEIALKGLMVTRTLCSGFSLGAADSAFRTVLKFARERKLYGGALMEIAHVRRVLARNMASIMACDCMATAAARSLHVAPRESSIWSAVTKYMVPVTVENSIRELAVILGARHYVQEGPTAIFAKMARDAALISLFDGSTIVNLQAIAAQLERVTRKTQEAPPNVVRLRLENLFSLDRPVDRFEPERLQLSCAEPSDVTAGLMISLDALRESRGPADPNAKVCSGLIKASEKLLYELDRMHAEVRTLPASGPMEPRSPELLAMAERYCVLFGAATCIHLWTYSRGTLSGIWAAGDWLVAWLAKCGLMPASSEAAACANMFSELEGLVW